MHLSMDGYECWVLVEEFLKFALLSRCKPRRSFAHGGESASVVLEFWCHSPGQGHEVMVDDPHHVKAIGHDSGIGKETADHVAVRAGEVDADHFHFVAAA